VALFKILKGSKIDLPSKITEGYMYITKDTGDIYVDLSTDKRIRLNAEAADKIRKLTYNSEEETYTEVSMSYDEILSNIANAKNSLQTQINSIENTLTNKSDSDHTHNYAGSSTAGGSATSAEKLTTSTAGGANTPVYFEGGKPKACTGLSLDTTGNAATATKLYINNDSTSKVYVLGATNTGNQSVYREASVYMQNNVIYGAAWNDYAEYREGTEEFEPGRVICENGDDTLSLAIERLQPGASVVSDTFGFAIGQTEKSKTPIAVSGRVLVYPYEDRSSYKAGDAVCAAPNGTVSKMTREEIREYPERIVGTVSAIPNYETWGEGNVPVNGRIWIKVK
jgi:hypothetical protein